MKNRNIILNAYEIISKNKDTIIESGRKFPFKKEEWYSLMLEEREFSVGEIMALANYCGCRPSDLGISKYVSKELSFGLTTKIREFFELEQNELNYRNTMRVLNGSSM